MLGTLIEPAAAGSSEAVTSVASPFHLSAASGTSKITAPVQKLSQSEAQEIKNNLYFRQLVDDFDNRQPELGTFCREHGAYAVARYASAYDEHSFKEPGMIRTLQHASTERRDDFISDCLEYRESDTAHDEHAGYLEFEQLVDRSLSASSASIFGDLERFSFLWGTNAVKKHVANYLEKHSLKKEFQLRLSEFVLICLTFSTSGHITALEKSNLLDLYKKAPSPVSAVLAPVVDKLDELSLHHMQNQIRDGAADLNRWKNDIDSIHQTITTALRETTSTLEEITREGEEIITSCEQLNQEYEAKGNKAPVDVEKVQQAVNGLLAFHVKDLGDEEQLTLFNEEKESALSILKSFETLTPPSSTALQQKVTQFLENFQQSKDLIATTEKIAKDETDKELAIALEKRQKNSKDRFSRSHKVVLQNASIFEHQYQEDKEILLRKACSERENFLFNVASVLEYQEISMSLKDTDFFKTYLETKKNLLTIKDEVRKELPTLASRLLETYLAEAESVQNDS
ncbi:MAG: hypothetical protein ACOYK6_01915 [Chthoniobacterales bacterium]